jgi:DNA processing protein
MQRNIGQTVNEGTGEQSSQLENWLKLAQIPNFGVAKVAKLCGKMGISLEQILAESAPNLGLLGFTAIQIEAIVRPNVSWLNASLDWLSVSTERFILHVEHPDYPELLKQIPSVPPLLYGYGDPRVLSHHQLAIVGSRNPSPQGKENALRFSYQLSQVGWTITSGLALGIDGLSHQGALNNNGITVAVLGTAIDKMYPQRHIRLAQQILEHKGLILSEFAPGTPMRAEYFPRRNRIISGLALGVLIVEAALKSGSLITAKYGVEQNREVFVIPGNILNPLSAGGHSLIQQGAKLVTCIEDINEEFQHLPCTWARTKHHKAQKNMTQSLASDKLLASVDFEITPLDIVVQRSGLEVSIVMSQLIEYELSGLVAAVPGGYIKLGGK